MVRAQFSPSDGITPHSLSKTIRLADGEGVERSGSDAAEGVSGADRRLLHRLRICFCGNRRTF